MHKAKYKPRNRKKNRVQDFKKIKQLYKELSPLWEDIRRRQWHPTPVLLPGKSHGQRSLVGCSPWGHEESDTTERLHFHFSLSCLGEGNGNPLQCSCLENPRDGAAWWAAVCGVAQSRTQLKWLSSRLGSMGRHYPVKCCGLTYIFLPHSYVEALIVHVIVLKDEAFGK